LSADAQDKEFCLAPDYSPLLMGKGTQTVNSPCCRSTTVQYGE